MVLYTENKAGENVIKFQDENKQTHSIKVNSNFSLFVQYKADFSLILDPSPFNFWCFLAKSFFSHLPPIFRVLYSNSWPFLRANICRYRLLCPSVASSLSIISPRFKSLIKRSLFILILHGDYVFIFILYSWPLADKVTWPNIWWEAVRYKIKTKTTFRKARQKQSGLNHGDI